MIKIHTDKFNKRNTYYILVASVIHREESITNKHSVDVGDSLEGYIVSHSGFGLRNYDRNIDSTLTLFGLSQDVQSIRVNGSGSLGNGMLLITSKGSSVQLIGNVNQFGSGSIVIREEVNFRFEGGGRSANGFLLYYACKFTHSK